MLARSSRGGARRARSSSRAPWSEDPEVQGERGRAEVSRGGVGHLGAEETKERIEAAFIGCAAALAEVERRTADRAGQVLSSLQKGEVSAEPAAQQPAPREGAP